MAFPNPTAAYTAAKVAAMTPQIWSPIVNEPNFPKAVLTNFFTDLSQYMDEGGSVVHVPNIYTNIFTATTQTNEGDGVIDQSPAQVDVTLTIATHLYVAWIIGDRTMKQLSTIYSLNEKYAREAKNVLTVSVEVALASLWSSLTTNVFGSTTLAIQDIDIRNAINALDTGNFDLNETAFFFHPYIFWAQLGGIVKYYSQYASGLNFIRSGNFGPSDASRGLRGVIYDQPVYVTTNIVSSGGAYRNLFAHPSAFGFAFQTPGMGGGTTDGNRFRVQADYLLQNLGMLTVVDTIFGVGVLREPAAALVNGNNATVTP